MERNSLLTIFHFCKGEIKLKSKYKHFFLTVIGYFAGNVFTKLISFILLPLYTKLIDPEVYGIYGVNMTIIQLVVGIVYVAIWNAVFRYAAECDTDEGRYEIISTGLPVMWFSSTICTIVLLIINLFWDLSNPYLVCIYAIANGFQYFYGYVARSMKDNRIFIISGCVNSTINLLFNWIGIAYLHYGIEVLYFSYIIGTAIQILIIEFKFHVLKHFKKIYVQKTRLTKLMKFGAPLALNSVMQWLLTGLTQIMIAYMLGTYYNGLFSVAVKFATLISLIVSVFEYAWLELAYDIAKNDNSALYYKRVFNMLFGVLMFGVSVLILVIKILFPYFIAEAYYECLEIIPYIAIYACANAFASFSASIYMSYKAVNTLMVSSLASGGTNFLLLILLIPSFGFHGALLSLVAASVLMMLIRIIVLHIKYKICLDLSTTLYIILIPVCCFVFYMTNKVLIDGIAILVCAVLFLFAVRNMYFKYMIGKSHETL